MRRSCPDSLRLSPFIVMKSVSIGEDKTCTPAMRGPIALGIAVGMAIAGYLDIPPARLGDGRPGRRPKHKYDSPYLCYARPRRRATLACLDIDKQQRPAANIPGETLDGKLSAASLARSVRAG